MPSTKHVPQAQVDPLDLESKTDEERIQLAPDAIARNGFKANGQPWVSLHKAAGCFNISKLTLTVQFNGRKSKKEAHEHEKTLSFAAETALVEWVAELGCCGIPLHASAVVQHASVISGIKVSKHWVHRFQARHPELKLEWTTGLEHCRAQTMNPTAVAGFYDNLKDILDKYDILEENIYNMDEKGIQLGMGKRVCAMVD